MTMTRHAGALALATLVAAAGFAASPAPAIADAGSFLRSISGDYRGRGTAKIPGRPEQERVSCNVNNRYDKAASALEVSGKCATTQSKSSVSGKLSHSGNSVTGSLIGAVGGATITKSNGEVSGNRLVVSTNFMENATGTLTRTRQVISKTGSGFKADFYTFNNKQDKFERAGSISFTAN